MTNDDLITDTNNASQLTTATSSKKKKKKKNRDPDESTLRHEIHEILSCSDYSTSSPKKKKGQAEIEIPEESALKSPKKKSKKSSPGQDTEEGNSVEEIAYQADVDNSEESTSKSSKKKKKKTKSLPASVNPGQDIEEVNGIVDSAVEAETDYLQVNASKSTKKKKKKLPSVAPGQDTENDNSRIEVSAIQAEIDDAEVSTSKSPKKKKKHSVPPNVAAGEDAEKGNSIENSAIQVEMDSSEVSTSKSPKKKKRKPNVEEDNSIEVSAIQHSSELSAGSDDVQILEIRESSLMNGHSEMKKMDGQWVIEEQGKKKSGKGKKNKKKTPLSEIESEAHDTVQHLTVEQGGNVQKGASSEAKENLNQLFTAQKLDEMLDLYVAKRSLGLGKGMEKEGQPSSSDPQRKLQLQTKNDNIPTDHGKSHKKSASKRQLENCAKTSDNEKIKRKKTEKVSLEKELVTLETEQGQKSKKIRKQQEKKKPGVKAKGNKKDSSAARADRSTNSDVTQRLAEVIDLDDKEDYPSFSTTKYKILTKEELEDKLSRVLILNKSVHEEHTIEKSVTMSLHKDAREELKPLEMIANGKSWIKAEDRILQENWESFCKEQKLNPKVDWQLFELTSGASKSDILAFYRCMGLGLAKRTLQSICRRFIHIHKFGSRKKKKGYSKDEDDFMLKFMANNNSADRFARLAEILGRDRKTVRRHFLLLERNEEQLSCEQAFTKHHQLSKERLTTIIRAIMEVTGRTTIHDLKKLKVLPCKEVAEKLNIGEDLVQRIWARFLYHKLKLKEPVLRKKIEFAAVQAVLEQNCEDITEVSWKQVAKRVVPFHRSRLYDFITEKIRYIPGAREHTFKKKCTLMLKQLSRELADPERLPGENDYIKPLQIREDGEVIC